MNPSRALVWDLPVRLFHWLFAAGFAAAAIIALGLDEDSPVFPYHAIIGLVLMFLVVLRVIWAFIGTRYARFGSLAFSPRSLVTYLVGALTGRARSYVGANPGSAYAALAMALIVAALTATGILLGMGNEGVKEVHEVLAYLMLAVVVSHLLGIALHSVRHRENIAASMVHGFRFADASAAIRSARPLAGAVMVLLTLGWIAMLLARYDPATQTARIPVLDTALQFGESEHERASRPIGEIDREREDEEHE